MQGKKKSPFKRITGFEFSPSDPTRLMVTSADSQIFHGVDVICKYRGLQMQENLISWLRVHNANCHSLRLIISHWTTDCFLTLCSGVLQHGQRKIFLQAHRFCNVQISVQALEDVMPEHAWGLAIVTGGWDGRIKSFQNCGLPVRH